MTQEVAVAVLFIRKRYGRSQDIWGAAFTTVLLGVVAAADRPGLWGYVAVGAFVVLTWAFAISQVRRTWIRVSVDELEIKAPPAKRIRMPRSQIRWIEAHPGHRYFEIYGDAGKPQIFRGQWFSDDMHAVGQALGVPVCLGDNPSCRHA